MRWGKRTKKILSSKPVQSLGRKVAELNGTIPKSKTSKKAAKTAKADRKSKIRDTYLEINSKTKLADALIYNSATRKKASKYVVDNDMSFEDATKKAKGEALRNTAIFIGVYGAMKVAEKYLE